MKILFAASEALPFAASGGLADVAGSLPAALGKHDDIDCRVVMPLYRSVTPNVRNKMTYLKDITVEVGWRKQYCGIYTIQVGKVTYYLLDNPYYFMRDGMYGFYDDCERFVFFSRAVLEILPALDWKPDIIHCNDWQTAMVPVFYRVLYQYHQEFENIRIIYTIHNIQYQGIYGKEVITELMGLPTYHTSLLEFDGMVNLMKGAIETADRITTVSPTYAAQLRESAYAAGLDSVVRSIQWKFSGVLNGIDMVSYDPECDPDLPARYTAAESEGKTLCKAALQQELGLAQEEGTPVLSMVTRLVGHKGVDLVCQALDGIMATGCQLVVLGSGDGGYENFFRHAQNRYPGRLCAWIGYNEGLSRRIYAGSDLFLMPSKSEPCGLSQMIAMRYGAVPIVRQTGGLNDTVRSCQVGQPDGNGYVFAAYDAGAMLDTIGQAVGLYHGDAEGFRMVRRRGMEGDFSWDRSAGAYRNIYGKLLGR